jgi:CxxC motif-containing protein (DUF1111 family)
VEQGLKGWEVKMAKSQLAYGVSLAAIAVMMLGATAQAQNVTAARAGGGFQRGGGGHHSGGGGSSHAQSGAVDPGIRGGAAGSGDPLPGISTDQMNFFTVAKDTFNEVDTVPLGLGPGFNLDGCGGCHSFPASGGASPPTNNPQIAVATALGATNAVPSFITANGPIREVRFVRNPDGTPDGGVHDLFSIAGRSDAGGCDLAQPDFAKQFANNNVIFRIPISTYGDGLIESLSDGTLQADFDAQAQQKASLGISGAFNTSGNTGNITRFGWKAQNMSMLMFAGEAYNVEQGVTNELFPNERNNPDASCQLNATPEDGTPLTVATPSASQAADFNSDISRFAMYMRLLAPPTPAIPLNIPSGGTASTSTATTASTAMASTATATTSTADPTATSTTPASATVALASVLPAAAATSTTSTAAAAASASATSAASINSGLQAFINVGCAACHTVSHTTGNSALGTAGTNVTINSFSDYATHNMGNGLADRVTQGNANGFMFRSAPLWGVGQRAFLLHDGRTSDLVQAIEQHASSGSEANQVIGQFNMLSTTDQQNILNFLRDL